MDLRGRQVVHRRSGEPPSCVEVSALACVVAERLHLGRGQHADLGRGQGLDLRRGDGRDLGGGQVGDRRGREARDLAVENSLRSSAFRLRRRQVLSWVVVRPCVCVVDSASSCVVEKLPTAVVVRPPSCVAVIALAWVVEKACTSVVVSAPMLRRGQDRDLGRRQRADLRGGQVGDRRGVEARRPGRSRTR